VMTSEPPILEMEKKGLDRATVKRFVDTRKASFDPLVAIAEYLGVTASVTPHQKSLSAGTQSNRSCFVPVASAILRDSKAKFG
jgi:hypothetical protein